MRYHPLAVKFSLRRRAPSARPPLRQPVDEDDESERYEGEGQDGDTEPKGLLGSDTIRYRADVAQW
jgi:hypothetical protein